MTACDLTLFFYSDFLLEQNQPEKVLALLKDESRDDALLLRLAIAAQHNRYKKELMDRYRAAQLKGSNLHERDKARFLLELENRPVEALKKTGRYRRNSRTPYY